MLSQNAMEIQQHHLEQELKVNCCFTWIHAIVFLVILGLLLLRFGIEVQYVPTSCFLSLINELDGKVYWTWFDENWNAHTFAVDIVDIVPYNETQKDCWYNSNALSESPRFTMYSPTYVSDMILILSVIFIIGAVEMNK